jgi:hypothetical protein
MSQAIREAYARAGSTTVHLLALEMRHYTWPAPARVINHKVAVSITLEATAPANPGESVTFTALAMEIKEPEIGTDPAGEMEIRMDGVAGSMQPLFDAANSTGVPVDATIRAVALNSSNNSVIGVFTPYDLQVKEVQIGLADIGVTFGRVSPVNQPFPAINYGPDTYPQLYK